jgi:hypothetical protein
MFSSVNTSLLLVPTAVEQISDGKSAKRGGNIYFCNMLLKQVSEVRDFSLHFLEIVTIRVCYG